MIEWQVCPKDLAEKLAELGVVQESAFYWVDGELCVKKDRRLLSMTWGSSLNYHLDKSGVFSAYTVAELGAMLGGDLSARVDLEEEWFTARELSGQLLANISVGESVHMVEHYSIEEVNQRLLNAQRKSKQ
jgi:hypothetical protein